jgi:acetyl-CoA carboxylase biotin carboxyl carrier protein
MEEHMTPVISPMVGKILNVQVKVGDKVQEDETVMVMEAMKMEIPIVAPAAGTIKEIKVGVGDMVESEAVVALME